jgi:beta-glucosidase
MRLDGRSARLGLCLGLFSLVALRAASAGALDAPPRLDPAIEARIEQLLKQMTLDEKLDMLSGTGFDSKPLPRLGIPAMAMTDGPAGVRAEKSTAFPAPVALAASWDPALVEQVGAAIAREARAHGKNVLLAPCVNIHRVPQGGRNFESYGEDPFLAARVAVAYVKGVQSQHVMATVKHFACNNQETDRNAVDVKVDERTLNEVYLPAFKAAVQEGGVWAVMGAYNRVNGEYACANRTLLSDILKKSWGFLGLVMSDWGAVHGVAPYVNAGLDLEMPGGQFFTQDNLHKALSAGEIDAAAIDDKVRRMLRAMLTVGLFDEKQDRGALDTPEDRVLNRRAAAEGIVLLKNDFDFLPLRAWDSKPTPQPEVEPTNEREERRRDVEESTGQSASTRARVTRPVIQSVALIGQNATIARTGGGGSSRVAPTYVVNLLDALRARLGKRASIGYAPGVLLEGDIVLPSADVFAPPAGHEGTRGLWAEYFSNAQLAGEPAAQRLEETVVLDLAKLPEGVERQRFSIRWTGALKVRASGKYALTTMCVGGCRLYLDGRLLIDDSGAHGLAGKSATVDLKAAVGHPLRVEYVANQRREAAMVLGLTPVQREPVKQAAELARHSQVAIVCIGLSAAFESEGADRATLALPPGQDELVAAVVAANPRTIVVINSGAAVQLGDWVARVPSIIQAWYPGQEGAHALADILVGDVNPSGRLPTTFLRRWEDSPAYGNFPGTDGVVNYAEGVFVGYRHFEAQNVDVLFPFGHGLSYTTFAYRDLRITPKRMARGRSVEASFVLRNTGRREGAEVVQFYVGARRPRLPRPVKELKGFQRITLKPNEEQTVRFTIDEQALSFYDPAAHAWVAEEGSFDLYVAASSKDVWLRGEFALE